MSKEKEVEVDAALAGEAKAKATKKTAPKKKAPKKQPLVRKVPDHKNGVTRPGKNTKTGRIWEIADTLSKKMAEPAPRRDVLAQAKDEEINMATAATQYGRWRKYNGLKGKGTEE